MVVRRCGEGNGRVNIDASFGQKIVPRLRNNAIFRHTHTAHLHLLAGHERPSREVQ